jgi:hypothetical protein
VGARDNPNEFGCRYKGRGRSAAKLVALCPWTRDTRDMSRTAAAVVLLALGVALVVASTGCGGEEGGTNPSDTHVAMGAHNFVQFACSSCHGEQGKGACRQTSPL